MINVVIADAQDLSRFGLGKMFGNSNSDINIVGEAVNKRELWAILREHTIDIVCIDPLYNDIFGWQSIKQIRQLQPDCHIILIAEGANMQDVRLSIQFHCKGFLTKTCDSKEIFQAVYAVYNGNSMMCHKILELVHDTKSGTKIKDCSPCNLSSREIEIIKHTALGKSAKTIAGDLFLSTHTVYTHKKNIMKKLGVNTTSELILYALDNNLTSR